MYSKVRDRHPVLKHVCRPALKFFYRPEKFRSHFLHGTLTARKLADLREVSRMQLKA